jgi:hypothetical protein
MKQAYPYPFQPIINREFRAREDELRESGEFPLESIWQAINLKIFLGLACRDQVLLGSSVGCSMDEKRYIRSEFFPKPREKQKCLFSGVVCGTGRQFPSTGMRLLALKRGMCWPVCTREAEVLGVMKPILSLSILLVLSVKIILPLSTPPVDGR